MPELELPAPLRGQDGDSWARHSIVDRLPEIGRRTLAESTFPPNVADSIRALIDEIPSAKIQPITDPGAPDAESWQGYVEPHLGDDWLTAPWFFVETYFYRRIIAAVGYFDPTGTARLDPFDTQKKRALPRADEVVGDQPGDASSPDLLLASLWANQADLSLWPHGSEDGKRSSPAAAAERILVDERGRIAHQLEIARAGGRMDLVLDNVGAELAADLLLADYALAGSDRTVVKLHAKLHPTFVSDATIDDIHGTLDHWLDTGSRLADLADRLRASIAAGRLLLGAHSFWTSPLAGWQMPTDLRRELSAADLLLFKGDANYRRLFGDRHWPWTTPVERVVSYLPAPAGALRSLKADVAAGLDQETIERTAAIDPDWMIDGRWALVQFVDTQNERLSADRSPSPQIAD